MIDKILLFLSANTKFSIQPGSVDLVCFPEMIFTGINNLAITVSIQAYISLLGYDFPSAEAIKPFLEEPKKGTTSKFCESLAKHLGCYVTAGYPEGIKNEEKGFRDDGSPMVGANSAIICDRDGNCIGNYRKVNMWETDKTWAKPGNHIHFVISLLLH